MKGEEGEKRKKKKKAKSALNHEGKSLLKIQPKLGRLNIGSCKAKNTGISKEEDMEISHVYRGEIKRTNNDNSHSQ